MYRYSWNIVVRIMLLERIRYVHDDDIVKRVWAHPSSVCMYEVSFFIRFTFINSNKAQLINSNITVEDKEKLETLK